MVHVDMQIRGVVDTHYHFVPRELLASQTKTHIRNGHIYTTADSESDINEQHGH